MLIERQQGNDEVDLARREVEKRLEANKKMDEKLALFENSLETLANELRLYKAREEELRETVQLERQRTKKLQISLEET